MNMVKMAAAVAALALLGGCQTTDAFIGKVGDGIKNDPVHSGGTVGYFADNLLPAVSKKVELYRAVILVDLISDVAANDLRTDNDIVLFATSLDQFQDDIQTIDGYLASAASTNCDLPTDATAKTIASSTSCRLWFERYVPMIEGDVLKLAQLSVPNDQIEQIYTDIKSGNFTGAAQVLVKLSGTELVNAHEVAADYRSITEAHARLLARVWVLSGVASPPPLETDTVQDAAAYIHSFGVADGSTHAIWVALKPKAKRDKLDVLLADQIEIIDIDINGSCKVLRDHMTTTNQGKFPAALWPAGAATTACQYKSSH